MNWAGSLTLALDNASSALFNLVFPDECRICEENLQNFTRIPVCTSCLALPEPLPSEYFCRSCRTPFVNSYPLDDQGLCTYCREGLVNFDAAYSFGSYEGTLRKLIHAFKYGKVEALDRPLSRLIFRALPLDDRFDVVIAMPMHWLKQWKRGFNQAQLLARAVAKRLGLPLSTCLRRSKITKAQAGLSEAQRRDNLKGSFSVRRPAKAAGKRILLIDDVFTTGATLREAAAVLKRAGAAHVTALTLARVDRRAFYGGKTVSSRDANFGMVAAG